MILNLKNFNAFVLYHHFKMDTLQTAVTLMSKNCYMASIDLKDAYFSVPIASSSRKFLKFEWEVSLYQYTCLPNDLASAPRIFTKLLKPIFSCLRCQGYTCLGYIDDSFFQHDTYQGCANTVLEAVALFQSLGFIIHDEKSVLEPTQRLVFLGFLLNSTNMTVRPTEEKNCSG